MQWAGQLGHTHVHRQWRLGAGGGGAGTLYQQEGVGGDHKQAGPCRWPGGGVSVGRGDVGGVDWSGGGGDRLEGGGEWAVKERAVLRGSWVRSVDRDQVYDKRRSAGLAS